MATVNDIMDIAPNQAPRERINANYAVERSLLTLALTNGGGGDGAAVSSVEVFANSDGWLDTGIVLLPTDALIMEATGAISHNAGPDPLYGPKEGVAELRVVVMPDGTTPVGDVAGQISYRIKRALVDQTGRVHLWIRDVGGKGDNRGSFIVILTLYRGGMATVIRLLVERTP